MIIKCGCSNEYQDKKHGKGMRVCNEVKTPPNTTPQFRCTVCLADK